MSAKKIYKNTKKGAIGFSISASQDILIEPNGKQELSEAEVKYIQKDKVAKILFNQHLKEVTGKEEDEREEEALTRDELERRVASLGIENSKLQEDLEVTTKQLEGVKLAKEELSEKNKTLLSENDKLKKHAEELSKDK